jgi:hypothetical protein
MLKPPHGEGKKISVDLVAAGGFQPPIPFGRDILSVVCIAFHHAAIKLNLVHSII